MSFQYIKAFKMGVVKLYDMEGF